MKRTVKQNPRRSTSFKGWLLRLPFVRLVCAWVGRHRLETVCITMAVFVFCGPLLATVFGSSSPAEPERFWRDDEPTWLWRDLLWPEPGPPGMGVFGWLILAGVILVARTVRFERSRPKPAPLSPSHGQATIMVFGQRVTRPAFLDRLEALTWPGRPTIFYTDADGQMQGVKPILSRMHAIGEILCLESLVESARLEREKRGHRTTDQTGRPIDPELTAAGVLVERTESDGNTTVIIATGFGRVLLPAEYQEAQRMGIGVARGMWRSQPPQANPRSDINRNAGWLPTRAEAMLLFKVELRAVTVANATQQSDPLAPPSTEKGGARFAWPFPPNGSEQ